MTQSLERKPGASEPNVMIVDDHPDNLELLGRVLRDEGIQTYVFPSGELALRAAARRPPDVILLDINMPGMDGYEVCRRIKASPAIADTPVLFLSALAESEDRIRGLEAGAVDFIGKPFNVAEVVARVQTHVELRRTRSHLRAQHRHMKAALDALSSSEYDSQIAVLLATARLAEMRDAAAEMHIERIQAYSSHLARLAAGDPHFAERVDEGFIDSIRQASSLHDLGNAYVSDQVLLKDGKLDARETGLARAHTERGAEHIQAVLDTHPGSRMLEMGVEIARWHHERWDGTGYPDGLRGEQIPLSARILGIVDTYDALTSSRCYRAGGSHQDATEVIEAGAGTDFDPELVRVFLADADGFRALAEECA